MTRPPRPRLSRVFALAAACGLLAGCGDGPQRAALFRAEKFVFNARKAEQELRLASQQPDSSKLMALRALYVRVRSAAKGLDPGGGPEAREQAQAVARTFGASEAAAVRLSQEAGRPELALESIEWLRSHTYGDSATERQAAFMAVAAYQGLRRYDDAVTEMKRIQATYPPSVSVGGNEDPVLAIPEAIVSLRRRLGDEDAASRELRDGLAYYQSCLTRRPPPPPELEAQIRARILRTYLELNQVGRALEEANNLERLLANVPALRPMLAEVAFAKGKVRASTEKDPSEGVAILDRLATDFPASPLAPRAIFEAGSQLEAKGRYDEAMTRYQAVLQRFPSVQEVAPAALFRVGLVQEKQDDWAHAKITLESVPVKYPRSVAAADAPIAVIQHYLRDDRKTAAEIYFPKALETYRNLVSSDSTGQWSPLFRSRMFQIYVAQKDSAGVYAITEEMLRLDPKHPYTAQVLLEAARAAASFGNSAKSAAYLRRYIQDYPKSPLVDKVRAELRRMGG